MKKQIHFILFTASSIFLFFSCKDINPDLERIGNEFEQQPCPGLPVVIYQGHEYSTIQIGEQCWLQENLNIGKMIDGSEHPTDNDTIEKFCFDNDPSLCDFYGGFYEWDELMQYSGSAGTKGICPEGWHIPTRKDMDILKDFTWENSNFIKQVVHIWSPGAFQYQSGRRSGHDPSQFWPTGFNAIPTGYKDTLQNSFVLEFGVSQSYIWLSDETSSQTAEALQLYRNEGGYYFKSMNKKFAFSVRCIKND